MRVSESFVAAVENDDLETVRHLTSSLPEKVILASRLETGDLVIHRAAGAPKVLNFLIELGADVNAVTPNSHGLRDPETSSSEDESDVDEPSGKTKVVDARLTTLHLSAASGHVECVRVLAKANGINVNARDGEGSTPLHLASTSGHLECVICLLANGASCAIPDNWGNTALHEAAWNGEIECCLALLAAGAELTKPGNERKTAADLAEDDGYDECASLLRNLEGCWNTALVAQLMLDVRQMSKRERKVSVHIHEQALKLMELEGNLLSSANALKDERAYTSDMELSLREAINSIKNSSSQLATKLALAEDKLTLTLSRIAATDRDLKSAEEHISQLKQAFDERSQEQASQHQMSTAESSILDSLSELQSKFGAMMEKLGDKLSMLEKKIQAVEEWAVKAELSGSKVEQNQGAAHGDVGGGDGTSAVIGRKKKNKRKSGTPNRTSVNQESDDAFVKASAGEQTVSAGSESRNEGPLTPASMVDTYTFPTPGSSVSAGTPSPKTAAADGDNEAAFGSEHGSPSDGLPPEDQLSSVREIKRVHLEFLRNSANERFSAAIGCCVETVAKLKDIMRLVTEYTKPSTMQVKASLEQWEAKLEEILDLQADFHEKLHDWEARGSIGDALKLPVISPLPNIPEVDVRVIAEQLASLHMAAKHKGGPSA